MMMAQADQARNPDAGAKPGTVVFSVDAELGWGHHDLPSPPALRVEYARTGWIRLLSLFNDFSIPATWALVGHLFLDDCDGRHRDHPSPADWFARERCAWADRPDLRFGRDLIERIVRAGPSHELACHGFSHMEFGADGTSERTALAELRATEAAAGRSFDSFVFPRNNVGHRRALAQMGFRCYRGQQSSDGVGPQRLRKIWRGVVGRPPSLVEPYTDEFGLISVPASMYLFEFEGPVRSLLGATIGDPVIRRVRLGVDAAARTGAVLHLWLHPNNLYLERHADRMRSILSHVATRRAEGRITVATMAEVADGV